MSCSSNKYFSVIVLNRLGLSHPLHNPLRRTNERNVGVCGQLSVSHALSGDPTGGGVSAQWARRWVVDKVRCLLCALGIPWPVKVRAAPFRSHPGWRHHKSADTGLVAKTTGQEMRAGKLSFLQIEFETVMILLILSPSKLMSNSFVIVGGAHHLDLGIQQNSLKLKSFARAEMLEVRGYSHCLNLLMFLLQMF